MMRDFDLDQDVQQQIQVEEISASSPMMDLLKTQGIVQTKTRYQTAVKVVERRNIPQVIKDVEYEAALAGEDFYYSYPQGGKYIEGVGINGALIVARNWGNCSVEARPFDLGDVFVIIGDFVDFQSGFNLSRPFLLKKKILKNKKGDAIYDKDRNDEIVFQVGTSKAMRNVSLNAVPNYIIDAGLKKAKEGFRKQLEEYIKKFGIGKACDKIVERAGRTNVALDRIELNFGHKATWDLDKILLISGALKGIEEGYQNVNDAFPKNTEKQKPAEQEVPAGVDPNTGEIKSDDIPEIESSGVVTEEKKEEPKESSKKKESKKEEPKVEKKPEVTFDESDPTVKENPNYWLWKFKSFMSIPEWNAFKKASKKDISAFGGKDYDIILKGMEETEDRLSRAGK